MQLIHILDLWSTLAVARAKFLFKNEQDPFEKIPEIYKQEMPRLAVTRFSATLKKMNVDLFLSRVVEVITLVLAHEKDTSSKLSLSEYLSMVFDDSSDLEEIPDEVCVMHVVHAFKLALEVREKDQGSRRSMLS